MRILIIVRHGSYGADRRLNDKGRQEIQTLAEAIKSRSLCIGRVHIISSPSKRAVESADLMKSVLSTECAIAQHELLFGYAVAEVHGTLLLRIIEQAAEGYDTLIVVTHKEVGDDFPTFFCKHLAIDSPRVFGIAKGHGIAINCEAKTVTTIP
jgi:phosphohistidine phosphatase SixA